VKKFDELMKNMELLGGLSSERKEDPVLTLFKRYQEFISEVFEQSLPENNQWAEWVGPSIEFVGPTFHKSFRQIDVIAGPGGGTIDMEIWRLLCNEELSCFWPALRRTFEE